MTIIKLIASACFSLVLNSLLAQQTDSVKFKGEWYKIYPFDQGYVDYHEHSNYEIFTPLYSLEDGKYVQFYELDYNQKFLSDKKKEKLNRKIYALFTIQNGQLNGQAVFLYRYSQKAFCYGTYQNNLKNGKWYYGSGFVKYDIYENGIRNGVAYEEYHLRRYSEYYPGYWTTYSNYKDGVYSGRESFLLSKGDTLIVVKSEMINIVSDDSTKLFNMELTRRFKQGQLYQESHFYSAKLDSTWTFDEQGNVRLFETEWQNSGNIEAWLFSFWLHQLPVPISELMILDELYLEKSFTKTDFCDAFALAKYKTDYFFRLDHITEEYYPNGQLKIKIDPDHGNPIIDTLYHANGKPFYYVKTIKQGFEAQYYDTTGTLIETKQCTRENSTKTKRGRHLRNPEKTAYHHKRIKNNPNKTGKKYRKKVLYQVIKKLPPLADSATFQDSLITSFKEIMGDSSSLTIQYNLKTRTRVETYHSGPYYGDEITYCLTYIFDSSYTKADAEIITTIGPSFSIKTQFTIETKFSDSYSNLMLEEAINCYTVERCLAYVPFNWRSRVTHMSTDYNIFNQTVNTIHDKGTWYFWNNEPFTGKMHCNINYQNKNKIKRKKEEVFIDMQRLFFVSFQGYNEINTHGLSRKYHKNFLFPQEDYFYQAPVSNLYRDEWRGYDEMWYPVFDNAHAYEVTLLNGKLDGDFVYRQNKKDEPVIMQYKQGVLVGGTYLVNDSKRWRSDNFKNYSLQFYDGNSMYLTCVNAYQDTLLIIKTKSDTLLEYYRQNLVYIDTLHVFKKESSVHVLFNDNQPASLLLKRYENGQLAEQAFLPCKNGKIHSAIDYDYLHGEFNEGKFTGYLEQNYGTHTARKYLVHDYIYKIELYLDQVKLSESLLDTSQYKVKLGMAYYYNDLPSSLIPDWYFEEVENPLELISFQQTTFYADGTIASEGRAFANLSRLHQTGRMGFNYWTLQLPDKKYEPWTYYNPQGELVRRVIYPESGMNFIEIYSDFIQEEDGSSSYYTSSGQSNAYVQTYKDTTTLRVYFYEHEKLVSVAHVESGFAIYECESNLTHEVYNLVLDYDVDGAGNKLLNPTRPATNYYDNGMVQSTGAYVNGKQDGVWRYYDPYGKLVAMGTFKDGKKEGRWLSGDLEGIAYLGDQCLTGDIPVVQEQLDDWSRTVMISISVFHEGKLLDTQYLNAYRRK
jgi:antitoxin component YwqK of YwqJK toxin-antitoxin module